MYEPSSTCDAPNLYELKCRTVLILKTVGMMQMKLQRAKFWKNFMGDETFTFFKAATL